MNIDEYYYDYELWSGVINTSSVDWNISTLVELLLCRLDLVPIFFTHIIS